MAMSLRHKKFWISFILVDVLLAFALFTLWSLSQENAVSAELDELGVTLFPQAQPLSGFNLTDQYNNDADEDLLTGKWSLVFFGFTSCPDVCPLTMRELARFYQDYEQPAWPLQVIMATVDPLRDDAAAMANYLGSIHPEFIGLTGTPAELARFARDLYVVFERRTSAPGDESHAEHVMLDEDDYSVDHSIHLSLISPEGELVAAFRPPHRARDLARSLPLLIDSLN